MMRRTGWLASGAAVLLAAAVWQVGVAGRWSRRILPGWSWALTQIGTFTLPDPETNRFGEQDTPALYERRIEAVGSGSTPNVVMLEERFTVWDVDGAVRWQAVSQAPVDVRTGAQAEGDHQGEALVFPRHVQRTTYRFHTGYLKGIPLVFQREELLEGLPTYLFSYKGRGEYTEMYAGTEESPGIDVKSWQDIRCADDQFLIQVWVEPVLGEVVKLEERCPSGDYVYETTTGLPVFPVARWGGVTAGDEVLSRVSALQRLRRRHAWQTRYLPLLLWLSGIGLVGMGLLIGAGVVRWRPSPIASGGTQ